MSVSLTDALRKAIRALHVNIGDLIGLFVRGTFRHREAVGDLPFCGIVVALTDNELVIELPRMRLADHFKEGSYVINGTRGIFLPFSNAP